MSAINIVVCLGAFLLANHLDQAAEPSGYSDLSIVLPKRRLPIPQALRRGDSPGFALRGIKGWKWKPDQYLRIVPFLAAHKMNFLMNCYTNMSDIEHYAWGDPKANRWWEPIPPEKAKWLKQLVSECQKYKIQFCFSMNPSLNSTRPLRYDSAADLDALWRHYAWMQGLGVRWFNISLDDIGEGIDGPGQVKLVNEIVRRLRIKDPHANLVFCPTWYWGRGDEPDKQAYFKAISQDLDKDVYLFWTGDYVLGPIRRQDAAAYRKAVNHRLFLWDNYPVNDDNPTMHLGPVIGRDKDLAEVADGYMSNSMCQQWDANRIPMLTCADYAFNPSAYDPDRSIAQAILNIARGHEQGELLRDLVLAYPGNLRVFDGRYNTGYNPVREKYRRLPAPERKAFCDQISQLLFRLDKVFPREYEPEKATVKADIAWMEEHLPSAT
jgi:hypothetical protein